LAASFAAFPIQDVTMLEWFSGLGPVMQALLAGSFTWLVTAVGAASVILTNRMSRALLDSMLGFAAGVMLSASFWSLLAPATELAEAQGTPAWLPATVGFLLGAAALWLTDQLLPHLHPLLPMARAEGIQTTWQRITLLVLAITIHNIPEGLAVGVAFGAAALDPANGSELLAGAIALAFGIALQNFPEGIAVSMPLRQAGASRAGSFMYGQLSALVEPFAAVLGAAAVMAVAPILPYALAFAAGAMVYVVVEELIPEAQQSGHTDLATTAIIVGFAVMMLLDVALG
jgi:ZIP family zinc transporter